MILIADFYPPKERIRNTLSHEMCHLASWVINQEPKEGHGKVWKSWCVEALLPTLTTYMWKNSRSCIADLLDILLL
jgi:predicted SprT family Zn-dependent metalloprotease